MIRRFAILLPVFFLGFLILFASVLRASEVRYSFNKTTKSSITTSAQNVYIDYDLPEATATPNNFFWPVIALNDRVETVFASDSLQRSLVLLSHSDNRLSVGLKMFDEGKIEESVSIFNKAEGYLEESLESFKLFSDSGSEETLILEKISLASLKHRQILEECLIDAPDDARAMITKTLDIPKSVYSETEIMLEKLGTNAPQNPF